MEKSASSYRGKGRRPCAASPARWGAVEAAVWRTLGEKRTESLIKTAALYNELFEEAAGR